MKKLCLALVMVLASTLARADVPYVLQFDNDPHKMNVNFGRFYQTGVPLPSSFFWDSWVAPNNAGATYFLIESATGAHALMMGFTQNGAGTQNTPSGTIFDGSTSVTVGGDEGAYNNEWVSYSESADSSWVYNHVNGILVGQTPWSGVRQTYNSDYNATGQLTLGGTDHSNYNGKVGGYVRGWEGFNPLPNPVLAFVPERFPTARSWDFGSTFTPASFIADLSTPTGTVIPDVSPCGFNGWGVLATPSAPSISCQGTSGSTSYSYKVAALYGEGTTPVSASGSTSSGNATLSSTNFNRVSFTPDPRAQGYQVFRTVGGATQGLVGTVGGNVGIFDDVGITALATPKAPSANTTACGQMHPGFYGGSDNGVSQGFPQSAAPSYPLPEWVTDSTAPFTHSAAPAAQSGYTPSATPVPVSARIYDDFERADQTFAFQDTPTLGSTVSGGSLGALAWTNFKFPGYASGASLWGIFHGRARFLDAIASGAVVDNSSSDQDVRVDRFVGSYNIGTTGTPVTTPSTGVIFGYTDVNNFMFATVYGDPRAASVLVGVYSSGSWITPAWESAPSGYTICSAPTNTSWTRLRVVLDTSGQTLTVYTGQASGGYDANGFPTYNWTQCLTRSSVTQTGNKTGIAMMSYTGNMGVSSLATWNNFQVNAP